MLLTTAMDKIWNIQFHFVIVVFIKVLHFIHAKVMYRQKFENVDKSRI